MRKHPRYRLPQWILTLGLLVAASAAYGQPCCECRCPGNEARACSEEFGLDDDAYLEAVCEPLGCSIAICADRSCARSNRCPREETGRCDDGFDNDADGGFDCDDPDCEGAEGCSGDPTPTTPSGGTPGASPTATPVGSPLDSPTETPTTPPGSPEATPTDTPETPGPTATPAPGERDCCVGRDDTAGCDGRNCERCVCRVDDFCCEAIWDVNCAMLAATECDNLCRCEIPDTTPTATPTATRTGSPAVASDCCIGRDEEEGPGCSVRACERCVCEVDDFCCEEFWDPSCADIAEVDCVDDCACDDVPPEPTATPTRTGSPPVTTTTVVAGSQTPTRAVFPTQTRRPCTTSDDCPRGQTCNSAGRCIGGASTPSDGNGGGGGGGSCTVQPTAEEPGFLAWLVVPAALWAGRRRHSPAKRGAR